MIKKNQFMLPPNSKESEMMVLGCMLTQVNHLNIACDRLVEKDFYYSEHQIVFKILKDLYMQDKPADVHLVSEELKKLEKLQEIGGVTYLTNLAQFAGTSAFIDEYISLVKEKAILRLMIQAAKEVERNALEDQNDVYVTLDKAQSLFYDISQMHQKGHNVLIKDLLSGAAAEAKLPYLKIIEERQEKYQKFGEDAVRVTGIPTHFLDLDKLINGFNQSNLMILAARPAMGKTALAVNLAENISFKNNVPVGIFSLEMDAEQLLHRIVCCQSEVESDKILKGNINGHEYQRIVESVNTMQKHIILIDDQPGITITDLRSRARRMKETYDIGFLVIDYLQLIYGSGSSRSMESRQIEVSEISRMLKNLARELNIPILCLSQLSRRVEERQGHRPMMSDLRESGSLEQDSDLVMFLLRPEYYDPYDRPGLAELIIAKNRHGPVGTVQMAYRKELAQFGNYSSTEALEDPANEDAFNSFSPN